MANILRWKFKEFACLCLILVMASCNSTRYLKDKERILNSQTIRAPKEINTTELENLYVKKSNQKLLGFMGSHLVWMYYTGLKKYDRQKFITKRNKIEARFNRKKVDSANLKALTNLQFKKSRKIEHQNNKIENGNDFMRWGEPLALFDPAAIKTTMDRFRDYLFARGYFHSKTRVASKEKNRKVEITYTIDPGKAYTIDSISTISSSPEIFALISDFRSGSKIKSGDNFNQDNLVKERERIELLMRDKGYYNFSRQMISFDVDTTGRKNNGIHLRINIEASADELKKFRLDSVRMIPDVGMEKYYSGTRDKGSYKGIKFEFFDKKYLKKTLSQRIFIHPDSLFSRSESFLTQRQLANLDMFKFVNINYDTTGGKFIANIFASPLENYSWSNEAGVSVTQGFPGPYYSASFKRRNTLKALEIFEINGRFGFEGVASATQQNDFYKSTEANINASVSFPQFLIPLSSEQYLKYARFNPRTKLLAGYTYTNRPEYQRSIITASSTLTWETPKGFQYSLTGTNLNIIRSDTSAAFGERLRELENVGNRLINAFKPAFVSNMSFSVTWNQHNYGNADNNSFFLRASIESGGTTLNIFSPSLITKWGLEPYKYLRLNVDMRQTNIVNKHTQLAFRVNTGVGYAYSSNKVLPYEKNFFVGGSNSIRAWRPRRLGPGSLPPALSTDPESNGLYDYRFEKPGDLLFEASAELRKKLFGFVNYALFVDVGNVWSIQSNTDPRSKFQTSQFFKEFGVGTGFGLRFDFTFLILRLDMGLKVYDPGRPEGDRFVLDKVRFFRPFGVDKEPVIFNIGIGYPF